MRGQRVSVTAIQSIEILITSHGSAVQGGSSLGKSDCCELTIRVLPHSSSGGFKFKVNSLINAPSYKRIAGRLRKPGLS